VKVVATAGLVAALLLATGCGTDEGPTAPVATSSSTPSEPSGSTSEPAEPAPTVAPATGIRLSVGHASLRVPDKWRLRNDYGFDFVKQATTGYSSVTVSELPNGAASLDALARQQQREQPEELTRRPDVVLGNGTSAVRLAGSDGPRSWIEVYGSVYLDAEWVIKFSLSDRDYPTAADRADAIASVLATWDSAAG
jgi:hypothetical protein